MSNLAIGGRSRLFVWFVTLLFLASCGGGSGSNPAPTLQSIAVSPQNASVAAGLSQQFSATGVYSDGTSRALTGLTWSSSDNKVATVSSTGLATTLKQGSVAISATAGSIANSAPLAVSAAVPTSLSITPANASVTIGGSAPTKMSAILLYSDNSSVDVSATATWSVANPFAANIDNSGNVTALRTGYATIGAASGAFSASAVFVVTAQPRYLYFMSGTGRLASKAIIEPSSGQLRMTGYIPTGANNYSVFPCLTIGPANNFLYTGAYLNGGGEIQGYNVDPATGVLTPLSGSPFSQAAPVGCIDFEPSGKFAYAASGVNSATDLLTYSADAVTGALTMVNNQTLPGTPTRGAIDPIGKYLYLAVFSSDFMSASAVGYSIDSLTGALTAISGTPFSISNRAGTFTFHPSGNFLFMANSGGASLDTYSVDRSTGKITAVATISTCANPTPIRFSPDGKFAYTACSEDIAGDPNSASLESFAVAANGSLTHLDSAPASKVPLDLTMDPSGQFLYMTDQFPHIQAFRVGADGIAKFVRSFGIPPNPGATMVALGGASPVTYTPKDAYITSTTDNALLTYSVNGDGTLALSDTVSTSTASFSLSLWPWGSNIAMASAVPSPNLLAFPVMPQSGMPGGADHFGNAILAGGVAIDPSGQFAFGTDATQGVIYTYYQSGGFWGLITYLTTPPSTYFTAGAGAGPIALDPSGLLVYVGNQVDQSISAYQYWGTSPELFEAKGQFVAPYTDGSPFAIGAKPIALGIDPNEAFLYVVAGDKTLRAFAIDYISGGHLGQVASVALGGQPSGLAVEATGHFVYTGDSTGLKAFSVDSKSGALTPVTLSPAIPLANITGVWAEPGGAYLYVTTGAQNVAGAVWAYSIGSDGNLTAVSAQPVATPALPSSMTFADQIQ